MLLTISSLNENNEINWEQVRNDLNCNASGFENLLFKVHLKRKKKRTMVFNKNTLKFLSLAYNSTNDVRYYNEFLWYCETATPDETLKKNCDLIFSKNLNNKGHHSHKFDLKEFTTIIKKQVSGKKGAPLTGKKIALVGVPVFFGQIHKILKERGADVRQMFISAHPSKFINSLFHIKPLMKFFSLVYNNRFHYETINARTDDPAIYNLLKSQDFDIGFHKLNFIIRPNIFDAFKIGLINDHWGPLPFIRGKSTLAYNLLLGFPITVTTHLVEKGIDTGKIIGFYQYDIEGITKIKKIKKKVKRDLSKRVVDSIERIAQPEFQFIDNPLAKGLTFYEIHPLLYKYIEEKMLSVS